MARNKRPRPLNKVSPDDNFSVGDINRLLANIEKEPAALQEVRLRLKTAQTGLAAVNALQANEPNFFQVEGREAIQKDFLQNKRVEENLLPRIALHDDARRVRVSTQATNSINRKYSDSSIHSYVMRNRNSGMNQSAGMAEASNNSWLELQERQKTLHGRMGNIRSNMMDIAENLYDDDGKRNPDALRQLRKNQARFTGLADELVKVNTGLDHSKREGKDPDSRFSALTKAQKSASSVIRTNDLEEQMKSGTGLGSFSPKDLKQKETEASLKLIKAMEELRKANGKSAEAVELFTKNAEEAAKELADIQDAQGMERGGGKYDAIKTIAGAVQEALSVVIAGYQNVAINQPMQMVANVQGAANLENEKYNMWHAAAAGDMTARMTLGAWKTGGEFGEQLATRQGIVHGTKIATNVIGAGLGAAQIYEAGVGAAGTLVGNSRIEAGAQGAKSLVSGLVGGVEEGLAWSRQTEKARLRIDGTRAVVGAAKALNHISGTQLQKYRDYTMGLNEAASFMGGATGNAFLNETAGTSFLDKMQVEGVGLKEMGALSAQGAATAGSMFKASNVLDAVHLENKGFGSASDNIRRMGVLGAAGSQDPGANLSRLIEEGMQRGLNSSKAIDMIVDNTARMTEESMKAGGVADPTAFLTRAILGAIDKNNPNKEMALQIAQQAYQSGEGARHNTATSFPGFINIGRLQEGLGMGSDMLSAGVIAKIPTMMLEAYRDKPPDELKAFLESRGVSHTTMAKMDQSLFEQNKLIDIVNATGSVAELAMQSGAGYATGEPGAFREILLKNKGDQKKLNALATGLDPSSLTDDERTARERLAAAHSLSGGNLAAVIRNIGSIEGIKFSDKTNATIDGQLQNEARAAAQDEKRMGNRAEGGQAGEGGKGLGADAGGTAGLKNLARTAKEAFATAGKNAETAWKDAASKTAENFGKSAINLNTASTKLGDAADNLIKNTDAMKVVSESFGAVVTKWGKEITDISDRLKKKIDDITPAKVKK